MKIKFYLTTSLFTLIELIVVIVILGILAAIVIPNVADMKDDSTQVSIVANSKNIQTSVDMYALKRDGEIPSVKPTELGKPQFVDLEKLNPNFLRNNPKDRGYYMVDSWGIVWGSKVLPPSKFKDDGESLSWESVEDSKGYNVYELSSLTKGEVSNSSLKFLSFTENNSIVPQDYSVEKRYFISAIDNKGNETAPVIEGYQLPEIPSYYQVDYNSPSQSQKEVEPYTPTTKSETAGLLKNGPTNAQYLDVMQDGSNIFLFWNGTKAKFNPNTQSLEGIESVNTGLSNFDFEKSSDGTVWIFSEESPNNGVLRGEHPEKGLVYKRLFSSHTSNVLPKRGHAISIHPNGKEVAVTNYDASLMRVTFNSLEELKNKVYVEKVEGWKTSNRSYEYGAGGKPFYSRGGQGLDFMTYGWYDLSISVKKKGEATTSRKELITFPSKRTGMEVHAIEDTNGRIWVVTEDTSNFKYSIINPDLTVFKSQELVFNESQNVTQPQFAMTPDGVIWLFYLKDNQIEYITFK